MIVCVMTLLVLLIFLFLKIKNYTAISAVLYFYIFHKTCTSYHTSTPRIVKSCERKNCLCCVLQPFAMEPFYFFLERF